MNRDCLCLLVPFQSNQRLVSVQKPRIHHTYCRANYFEHLRRHYLRIVVEAKTLEIGESVLLLCRVL